MKSVQDVFTLNNGVKIPCVGFGTWRLQDGDEVINSVLAAIELGYRHVDTATVYENERGVGDAIKRCGVPREELFITSKVWNTERGYEKSLAAFNLTMETLALDYLDLYLVHWPAAKGPRAEWEALNADTWRALEKLYKDGRIKAIGVSNFMPHHLNPLLITAEITPAVNQIEFHPGYYQWEAVELCREKNILIEAWAPLGKGVLFSNETVLSLAEKYGKTPAQICVRWCLQHGALPLPKSSTPARIKENANSLDFNLSPDDMALLDSLPEKTAWSGEHPDIVDF